MPRVKDLPIPRTPSVEAGEVEALERLDQAIEKYLVHWQRSLVTDEARPSDLFPAFQRYATDLLDAYASECIRLGKGPDFDTCLTDLTGYILTRILPDPAKKPLAAGPIYTVIFPWTATNPDDFADKDGDWETELVLCLQLPSVHLFEDSGLWNPWDLVRALREPAARHQFEREIGILLTRRSRHWRAQARKRSADEGGSPSVSEEYSQRARSRSQSEPTAQRARKRPGPRAKDEKLVELRRLVRQMFREGRVASSNMRAIGQPPSPSSRQMARPKLVSRSPKTPRRREKVAL